MARLLITRNEAAEISGVSISAVNKAVEQRVVKRRRLRGKTFLARDEAVALALFSELPVALPVSLKRKLRDWIVLTSPEDVGKEFELSAALRVTLTEDLAEVGKRAARYVRLREMYIEVSPKIMGGAPVIRGTRVPVRTLARLVEGGASREALREDYPHIPQEAYEVAVLWARAHPRRGRPSTSHHHAKPPTHVGVAITERIETRRADKDFQERLQRITEENEASCERLAR